MEHEQRFRWLIPWRWPLWLRIAFVPAGFAFYVLSASLAFYAADRFRSSFAFRVCEYVYWPVDQMYRHWGWVRTIGDWLRSLWVSMFG